MPTSSSSSFGTSSSTPGSITSPASDWELQLSQLLGQVGAQQYQWAQQQFARASAITDAQINNYIQAANTGMGMATSLGDRYQGIYGPMEDRYAAEAGRYDSDARIQHNMGAAESRAAQAGRAGLINAEQELQSYGIDPSSGRYQDLVRASNTANAASAAAAGEQARIATQDTGRSMREKAIQMGEQLPGAAVNSLNSAYQGVAGAENAALGLANTGVALTTSAHPYYSDAMAQQFPPTGQTARSLQGSQSASAGPNASSGKNSDPFNSDRFGRPSQGSPMGPNGPGGPVPGGTPINPRTMQAPNAGIARLNPDGSDPSLGYNPNDPMSNLDPTSREVAGVLNENNWNAGWPTGPGQNPYADTGDWGNTDVNNGGVPYYTGSEAKAQPDWNAPQTQPDTGWDNSQWQPSTQQNYGSWDNGAIGQMDTPAANWGSSDPYSDYGASEYGYAKGGPVIPDQAGGHVPSSMSPSGGRQVDDVNATIPQTGGQAQLNVDEFVIPRDVALWKGQEFFQKLIQQSRSARTGAPAKPSKGAARPQQGA